MKNNFNNTASDKQRLSITGAMKGVQRQMAALAPDPDQPGKKGPAFVKTSTADPANDDREAMLGCLLVECFMGAAFGEALNDTIDTPAYTPSVDWNKTIDVIDEFWTDRYGQQTRLGHKNVIGNDFNKTAAWHADMPRRLELEKHYADLAQQLETIDTAPAWQTTAKRHNIPAATL